MEITKYSYCQNCKGQKFTSISPLCVECQMTDPEAIARRKEKGKAYRSTENYRLALKKYRSGSNWKKIVKNQQARAIAKNASKPKQYCVVCGRRKQVNENPTCFKCNLLEHRREYRKKYNLSQGCRKSILKYHASEKYKNYLSELREATILGKIAYWNGQLEKFREVQNG